jgi:hypothetical protein
MAFQTGTKVDPRLMMADYSGFAKAAEIEAQGMKSFAESIGGGIAKFAKKAEQKKKKESGIAYTTEWATNNPEAAEKIGFDVRDEDGFFDPTNIAKSAREFYDTFGDDGFKAVVPQLLALEVKSETSADAANKEALEQLRDPVKFRNLQSVAASDDSLRIVYNEGVGTGGMYELQRATRPDGFLKTGIGKGYETVQFDDPAAELFRGQPGSAFIFGDQGLANRTGVFPGAKIPRRPEVEIDSTYNSDSITVDPNDLSNFSVAQ